MSGKGVFFVLCGIAMLFMPSAIVELGHRNKDIIEQSRKLGYVQAMLDAGIALQADSGCVGERFKAYWMDTTFTFKNR